LLKEQVLICSFAFLAHRKGHKNVLDRLYSTSAKFFRSVVAKSAYRFVVCVGKAFSQFARISPDKPSSFMPHDADLSRSERPPGGGFSFWETLENGRRGAAAMSSMDMDPRGDPKIAVSNGPHVSFWIRELPFSLVLILTLLGVAYSSLLRQPIMGYWEFLAPVIGLVCVGSGWSSANDRNARIQLIGTQALHWAAFLLVMNMILLPGVQAILNSNATGLAVLMLLALGTFTAGVHIFSWQICLLGVIMALCVPAAAWIEASALIVALISMAALAIGVVLWWRWHESRAQKT
jgi:hypothetical protein